MALAAAVWRTRTGVRRTAPTDTLSVDVSAATSPKPTASGGEGWIDRVEFSVSENGGAPTVYSVTTPGGRVPNYSDHDAPNPGVGGGMVRSHWWGITLGCSPSAAGITVAYGRVEVTAVAYSKAGTATPLVGSVVLFNDADGVDRRPNSDVLYVDGDAGNDSWDGSSPTFLGGSVGPKATPAKAMGSGECGGKTIHLAGNVGWIGSLDGPVWCSDDHWCTLVLAAGATLRRHATANTTFSISSSIGFNLRLSGDGDVIGAYLDVQRLGGAGNVRAWSDGVRRHSAFYTPSRPCSVRFVPEAGGESVFNFVGEPNNNNAQQYASCVRLVGLNKGFGNFDDVHDCEIAYTMAEAFVSNNATNGAGHSFANVYYHDQVAGTGLVRGWFNCLVHSGNLTISTAGLPAGQAKLSQTGPMFVNVFGSDDTLAPVDVAFTADELVGLSPTWKLRCTGFAAGGNNGDLPVVAVGYDGSTPYVIVENASAVPGVQNSGSLQTYYQPYGGTVDPHGDIWHGGGPHVNGILENLSVSNVWHVQGVFAEGSFGCTLNRFAIINWAVSSPYPGYDLAMAWTGTSTDCTVIGCTFDAGGSIGGTQTRLSLVDNVFQSINISPGTDAYIHSNHFVAGSTYGTGVTTGTWFDQRPINQLWAFTPSAARLNGGSGLWSRPTDWRWPGATADTKGADKSVGLQYWGVGSSSVTPAPSEALFTNPTAAFVMGSIAIAPAANEALFESVPGSIFALTISVTAPPSEAVFDSVPGTFTFHSHAVSPPPNQILIGNARASFIMGGVKVRPSANNLLLESVPGTPVFGGFAVTPSPSEAMFESVAGAIGLAGTSVTPSPSEALFESVAGAAVLGDVAATPAPSEALFESVEGAIVGDSAVSAPPSIATFESVPGAAVLGSIAAVAAPNEVLFDSGSPTATLGSFAVTPAPSEFLAESVAGALRFTSATVGGAVSEALFSSAGPVAVFGPIHTPPSKSQRPKRGRKLWMRIPWRKRPPYRG